MWKTMTCCPYIVLDMAACILGTKGARTSPLYTHTDLHKYGHTHAHTRTHTHTFLNQSQSLSLVSFNAWFLRFVVHWNKYPGSLFTVYRKFCLEFVDNHTILYQDIPFTDLVIWKGLYGYQKLIPNHLLKGDGLLKSVKTMSISNENTEVLCRK